MGCNPEITGFGVGIDAGWRGLGMDQQQGRPMKQLTKAIQRHVGVTDDGIIGRRTLDAIAAALGIEIVLDKQAFYAAVRKITGSLEQVQVDSIEAILKRAAHLPTQQIAYILATAWHEARFTPQPEWGRGKGRPYAKKGKYGQSQYGRGLIQLTWDRNYEWADRRLGLNGALLKDFDLALRPDIAADVLVLGMLEGAFASNGKPLEYYQKGDTFDYLHARQTVNRMDKAELIAGLARGFEGALRGKG